VNKSIDFVNLLTPQTAFSSSYPFFSKMSFQFCVSYGNHTHEIGGVSGMLHMLA